MNDPRFAEAVREASAAWRWIPYDATTVATPAVELVIAGGVARVHRIAAPVDRSTPRFVADVRSLAAGSGATSLSWIVPDDGRPTDLDRVLTAQGSAIVEELEVMARRLDAGPAPAAGAPGIDVCRVDTPELLEAAYAIDSAVLGTPVRSVRFRRVAATVLAEQVAAGAARTGYRYVVRVDGAAVATAGLTLAGPVARLWGAAVLPGHRGRGLYRALLYTRLAEAIDRGATTALTKARTVSSAPLLHRAGFDAYGRERHHRLPV